MSPVCGRPVFFILVGKLSGRIFNCPNCMLQCRDIRHTNGCIRKKAIISSLIQRTSVQQLALDVTIIVKLSLKDPRKGPNVPGWSVPYTASELEYADDCCELLKFSLLLNVNECLISVNVSQMIRTMAVMLIRQKIVLVSWIMDWTVFIFFGKMNTLLSCYLLNQNNEITIHCFNTIGMNA